MALHYDFTFKAYAEALYAALKDNPFYAVLEQSVDSRLGPRDAMLAYLDYSLLEARRYGELFIPEDHEFGASVWSRPIDSATASERTKRKKDFLREFLGLASLDTYERMVAFMSEASVAVTNDDTWYLSIVGVLPEYQGRGLGPHLIRPILDKTDGLGIDTYLETFTPRNIRFYERLGYRTEAAFDEPTTGCEYWVLIRHAGVGQS